MALVCQTDLNVKYILYDGWFVFERGSTSILSVNFRCILKPIMGMEIPSDGLRPFHTGIIHPRMVKEYTQGWYYYPHYWDTETQDWYNNSHYWDTES